EAAFAAHAAGLCVLPPKEDGSKAPLTDASGHWVVKEHRPSDAQVAGWYARGRSGLGIVCGNVSGNVEVLDFDDADTFQHFMEAAQLAGLGRSEERRVGKEGRGRGW